MKPKNKLALGALLTIFGGACIVFFSMFDFPSLNSTLIKLISFLVGAICGIGVVLALSALAQSKSSV